MPDELTPVTKSEGLKYAGVLPVMVFVLVNVALWLIQLYAAPEFPFALIVTLGWGSGMVAHYLNYYYKYGAGARQREDAIEQEIARYRERAGVYEKPKNDRRGNLEINDDGEIEDGYDDEASHGSSRKRG